MTTELWPLVFSLFDALCKPHNCHSATHLHFALKMHVFSSSLTMHDLLTEKSRARGVTTRACQYQNSMSFVAQDALLW